MHNKQHQSKGKWGGLLTLLAGSFIATLDFFIVNVAIPSMQRGLGATPAAIQLVVAGYGLAFAAGLITAGRLGDLFGRRRLFMIGLGLFTLASAVAGFAPNITELIATRIVQGVAAALLMPQVLALIHTMFDGKERSTAINAYGLSLGLGGVLGQVIGGALIGLNVADMGWRSIFLINVPIGIAALVAAWRNLPESKADAAARKRERLDIAGMLLAVSGVAAIVLPLVEGREQGWPEWTWISMTLSLPLSAGFVWYQRRLSARGGDPLIHMELFREKAFRVGLGATLSFNMAMGSFFFINALFLQQGLGLSALASGLMVLPLGIAFLLSSIVSEQLLPKLGKHTLTIGAAILAAGYGLTADLVASNLAHLWLLPGLIIAGAGMGLVLAPMQNIVLKNILPARAGAAAGVLSTMQEVGGALGIALVGTVFFSLLDGQADHAAFKHAFSESVLVILPFVAVVIGLVQLLGKRKRQRAEVKATQLAEIAG